MKYYSLNRKAPAVDFMTAAISGQAPDKGLYFPESIPQFSKKWLQEMETKSNATIAFDIIRPYAGNMIDDEALYAIAAASIDFPIPLKEVNQRIAVLELFHGPTLAFKDVGARFMSRCLSYFIQKHADTFRKKVTVLVATSGDTGGAVANGFNNVPGIDVVIMYPGGRVSAVQEKQLTANGPNIHAVQVNGSFDDCQRLVKTAFADPQLNEWLYLTSANSINVARWLPQQFYYAFAWKQWPDKDHPPVIAVPSGNFGNICAGLLAKASGLPVQHFVAACNSNQVIPDFMQTGNYRPQPSIATLSNAMDVGDPSNFVRVLELFEQQLHLLRDAVTAYSIDDAVTIETISRVKEETGYLLEPHGAVGYAALQKYFSSHLHEKGIVLETAHPVKFPDVFQKQLQLTLPLPSDVVQLMQQPSRVVSIQPEYVTLKDILLSLP